MEALDAEIKSVIVTIKITPSMKREVDRLMEDKEWRFSAFMRVAIQRELDRVKGESK